MSTKVTAKIRCDRCQERITSRDNDGMFGNGFIQHITVELTVNSRGTYDGRVIAAALARQGWKETEDLQLCPACKAWSPE